ncbi:MAG: indole-3-glycerol phosphate synthase TrpC [Rikenellaceae bacterium]|nr:indole-3-glycerol phosphate synthase TrpC [Rikenellaceae bacterium]
MDILEKILDTKREEVARAKARKPFESIREEARAVARPTVSFARSIRETRGGIIAEFKRRSPSKGDINRGARLEEVVAGYERAGAAAISVLTDRDYFAGSLDDLGQTRELVGLPLLRKDFIVDPYQICQARIYGADAILLIASALTPHEVSTLARFAHGLSLEVLLEIHGEHELGHICGEIDVVGVNNRNLSTFVTDTAVSRHLADHLPADRLKISESGISEPAAVRELAAGGYRGFLMGDNFMKQGDPAQALKRFLEALC